MPRARYPTRQQIEAAVAAARAAGLMVSALRICRDGSIELLDQPPPAEDSAYARLAASISGQGRRAA